MYKDEKFHRAKEIIHSLLILKEQNIDKVIEKIFIEIEFTEFHEYLYFLFILSLLFRWLY